MAGLWQGELLLLLDKKAEARTVLEEVAKASETEGMFDEAPLAARLLLGKMEPAAFLAAVRRAEVDYDNNAHFHVGLFHETNDRPDEARRAYQAALDASHNDNFPARIIREAIRRLDAR